MSTTRFLLVLSLFALFSFVYGKEGKEKHKLGIRGTVYYTSASYGGIPRDNSNLPGYPLKKYTLYAVRFVSKDSIPTVVKSFTTDDKGCFSVSLPAGSYGFVTAEEAKSGLKTGQVLPGVVKSWEGNVVKNSEWECNMSCPVILDTTSVENLVLTNNLSFFCVNCQ